MSTRRERLEQITAARDDMVPDLRTQMLIRAQALSIARRSLRLEGRDRERNLREEARYLDAIRRYDDGEDVSWPHGDDITWRTMLIDSMTRTEAAAVLASVPDPADLPVSWVHGRFAPTNQPATVSNAVEGEFTEILKPGLLRNTLAERGDRVRLVLSHGNHPYIGDLPLGQFTALYEDVGGGNFVAQPIRANYFTDLIAPLVRSQMLATSFGFGIGRGKNTEVWRWNDGPVREVNHIVLYEVTFTDRPVYRQGTTVKWSMDVPPSRPRSEHVEAELRERQRIRSELRTEAELLERRRVRAEIRVAAELRERRRVIDRIKQERNRK